MDDEWEEYINCTREEIEMLVDQVMLCCTFWFKWSQIILR